LEMLKIRKLKARKAVIKLKKLNSYFWNLKLEA
jgi:hypothetical protein